ncbi:MAG: tRNA (adenosine(37)-N6)-threonylcarbamoyltransferase complex ATPase subunit type 1 TsaE [Bdellovibrionales bacterium]|nr:tRNA (adenosine(37)-N6)-threonylcarbamoyltransferase complex ATPase subunit type 1 TsaE [Bdellovibrionales bacterium]
MRRVLREECDTQVFAQELSSLFKPGSMVALIGELGAGKTTFVRHFAQAVGASTPVSSPTYVLCHEYPAPDFFIEHWDLYRLVESPEELFIPPGPQVLRFIEWADRFPEVASLCDESIQFELQEDGARLVQWEK